MASAGFGRNLADRPSWPGSAHGTLTVSSYAQEAEPVVVVPYLAALSAIAGLVLAFYYYKAVEAAPAGNDRMVFLMTEIQKGAKEAGRHLSSTAVSSRGACRVRRTPSLRSWSGP